MARKIVERNISYDEARGIYYVCMDLGRDEQKRRLRQYKTFPNLSSARAALRDFQANREQARQMPRHQLTLEEWLDYWMDTIVRPNRAETTSYAYQKIIDNHLRPLLGDRLLLKLTPAEIQEKLLTSPMDRVEPPRAKQYEADFYNQEELKRLFQLLEGHRLEVPVKLAGTLGLRREELCGLRWENINFTRRVIYIREARTVFGSTIVEKETKNRSSVRTLYIPDDLCRVLKAEQERQKREVANPSGYVVLDRNGQPYSPNVLSLTFTRFIRANNLPRVTLHGLRHSFASIASVQGATLFDIGKALGHSTPSTTGRIYTHLIDRTHEETLLLVSAALK